MFTGLGKAYRFGGDFEVITWGPSHKEMGVIFMGEVDPSKHHVDIFI